MTLTAEHTELQADEIPWALKPEPAATFDTVDELAVEALGDAEIYRDLALESLTQTHQLTKKTQRQGETITRLRQEIREVRS